LIGLHGVKAGKDFDYHLERLGAIQMNTKCVKQVKTGNTSDDWKKEEPL